jgi:murein DD-endopeptidase MepM/ murein hydrolase activator NlpD
MTLKAGTGVTLITLILLVLWIMSRFYLTGEIASNESVVLAAPQPTPTPVINPPAFILPPNNIGAYYGFGIVRLAELATLHPAQPRFDVIIYEVQKGDTLFGIAEKYNLKPETILWGNYNTLADQPNRLKPGQKLTILPVNGVYYEWHAGDGLNGVSEYFGVKPEDIINWPGNHLSTASVGDFARPDIAPNTFLVVPGGRREFITWSAPRISRDNPAVARVLGPGACDGAWDGPVGNGTFIWPTGNHWLSGFDYSPETNHYGIDLGGKLGDPIYASDNGVVVYSGWNDWGYGNMVVIDHGSGWQSLYAHLSSFNVACGAAVYQGGVIGGMGSTGNSSGPHLHFELRVESSRVNPWSLLQ